MSDLKFWWQWVLANACAELVALGIVALAAIGMTEALPNAAQSRLAPVLGAGVLIGLGGGEGAVVGGLQWLIQRRRLAAVTARTWILATVTGALMAWTLGVLPNAVIESTGQSAALEVVTDEVLIGAYAVPLGFIAGIILAFPQWRVLRHYIARSALWLPANGFAWAMAMSLIFAAAGSVAQPVGPGKLLGTVFATPFSAGMMVGAVHGAALVWITRRDSARDAPV